VNAMLRAQNGYLDGAHPIRTDRDNEYSAFAQITHRMKSASARGKDGFSDLVEAVYHNRRLWTILATDLADANNGLPKDLRARLLYLAKFTRHHSSQVLAGRASVEALVEVNSIVMGGLRDRKVQS